MRRGENNLYVGTLELGRCRRATFSATQSTTIWTVWYGIFVWPMSPTAPPPIPQPTFTEVKEKFDRAMQLGSNEERVIHEFCDQMQIPFDKITLRFVRRLCGY